MKYIVIAIPGAADHPAEELGGKTPLEVAKIPNLHYLAKSGKVGTVKLTSDRLEVTPDVTFLNLLGYEAGKVYTGRGPLEAASLDVLLEPNEVAFRMNFITEASGVLADPTGGQITTKEAKALINFLNKKIASDFVRFFAGAEYRHIAVFKDSHGYEALSAKATPPDDFVGKRLDAHLPKGPGEELLKKMMYDAKLLLQDHEINQVRLDLGENPANMVWLWGQGVMPKLEKFGPNHEVSAGALMSDCEYARGAGRLAGLTVLEVGEKKGDLQNNYKKESDQLPDLLNEKDFVCVHLGICDEASRLGDLKAKIGAIEAVDFFIVSKVKACMEKTKDVRVLVTPCHAAPWKMKRSVRDTVPFVIAGKNLMAGEIDKFTEISAKASELKVPGGAELMDLLFSKTGMDKKS